MKKLHFVLLQLTNIAAIFIIIAYILDIYNPLMQFIDNKFTKLVLLVCGIVLLIANQLGMWLYWPRKSKKEEK